MHNDNNHNNHLSTDDVINRIKAEKSPLYTDATIRDAVSLVQRLGPEEALAKAELELDKINTSLTRRGAHASLRDFKDYWVDVKYLISKTIEASEKAFAN